MSGETADESGWHLLESFRDEIDRIDDRILGLLSRRQAAAEGIGKVKRSLDLEIVDPAREQRVLERLSARGRGSLDPEAIRTVYSGIMAAARRIQEPPCAGVPGPEETAGHEEARGFCGERDAVRHAGTRSPEQNLQSLHHAQTPGVLLAEGRATTPDRALVGIIGGTGRMGSWLAGLLERNGHRVTRAGRRTRIRPEDAASFCDVVVISVPLGSAIRVIEQVAPMVREDALLMDLTSVKEAPLKAMLQHSRSRVVGLHPLFGPAPDPDEGPLTVAACKGRGESEFQWIRSLLLGEGYRVKEVDPAAHDRLMAVIQGANHFSTMALALFLSRCGISPEELDAWSTPAFRSALGRIRALTSQPGELFQGLLTENPAVADRVTQYREAVETLSRALYSPGGEAFGEIFGRLAGAFGNGGGPFSRSLSSQGGTGPSDTGERKGERHA